MSQKDDKQHNITFDIESSDSEIEIVTGDGLFSRIKTKIKAKKVRKKKTLFIGKISKFNLNGSIGS